MTNPDKFTPRPEVNESPVDPTTPVILSLYITAYQYDQEGNLVDCFNESDLENAEGELQDYLVPEETIVNTSNLGTNGILVARYEMLNKLKNKKKNIL